MAKIYSPAGEFLSAREVANWANKVHRQAGGKGRVFTSDDFVNSPLKSTGTRLKGNMCDCGVDHWGMSSGEFTLLPLDDEAVATGGKAYMVCRKCGAHSHL